MTAFANWDEAIANTLAVWLRDPSQLVEDGHEPPTGPVLERAMEVCRALQADHQPPPVSIVPNHKGVDIHLPPYTYEVWKDGTVERVQRKAGAFPWRTRLRGTFQEEMQA